MVSTKVELNHGRIARARELDDLARLLFPGNKNHQRVFLAIFVELKWTDGQFLPELASLATRHGVSRRVLETVRAKMRRLGLINHVSRFGKKYGYREGWIFSRQFERGLIRLSELVARAKEPGPGAQERKERHLHEYL